MERPTRRQVLRAGGALVAATAGCTGRRGTTPRDEGSSSPPPDTPSDAPTETPTGTPTEPDAEHVAWRLQVDDAVEVAPAANDGTAYVGTADGTLYALDGADGREHWTVRADDPVQSVTVADGLVLAVFGTPELGDDHEVVALAEDGTERWRFMPGEWWLTVVGARGGTVYVATGDDAIASDGETLYALDRASGDVRWSAEVGDPGGGLVTDRAVYVPTYGRLYAYDHDGTRRWVHDDLDYGYRTLTVTGDTVALVTDTEDGGRVALGLAADDGSERWRLDDWLVTSLREVDGDLYAGGEHVAALDPATGERRWESGAGGSIYDAPVVDGTLYASGPPVAAVATDGGTVQWTAEPDVYLADPMAVIDGTVYVHASATRDDRNRHILGLGAAAGTERWRFVAEQPLEDPVVVGDAAQGAGGRSGGRLVAGSAGGVVYGFE